MDIKEFDLLTDEEKAFEVKMHINNISFLIMRCFVENKETEKKTIEELKEFISLHDKFTPVFLLETLVPDTVEGMISTSVLIKHSRNLYSLNYYKIRCSQVHAQRFTSIMRKAKRILNTRIW